MECPKPDNVATALGITLLIVEFIMGKNKTTKSASLLELAYRLTIGKIIKLIAYIGVRRLNREIKMNVAEGLDVDYANGEVILKGTLKDAQGIVIGSAEIKAKVGYVLNPRIDEIMAKVASGEIDLIPGTDIEKHLVLQVLQGIKAELSK